MSKKLIIFSLIGFGIIFLVQQNVDAHVWIPEDELTAYFDSNGVYTIVGAIKNSENFSVVPTIILNIQDNNMTISKSIEYVAIYPSKELPFKIKFPEITSKSPILKTPEISYVSTETHLVNVEVIYDETLVKHDDGHLTGRIINNGDTTVFNIKVLAIIHGFNEILDMGQNIEMIEKLEPGEITSFSMYPDPSISKEISYYSCFAPSDTTIVPMYAERNDDKYYFRYDAGSWYYDADFNDDGTELSMKTQTSFSLETYANFEFPPESENIKFQVYLNGEPKPFIQSVDEYENWHVAFTVLPRESGEILITGFQEDWEPPVNILIPDWIKNNAKWWSEKQLDDDVFLRGIEFMINQEIIKIPVPSSEDRGEKIIPNWIRNNASWWANGKIDDNSFVYGLQFLIKHGILRV